MASYDQIEPWTTNPPFWGLFTFFTFPTRHNQVDFVWKFWETGPESWGPRFRHIRHTPIFPVWTLRKAYTGRFFSLFLSFLGFWVLPIPEFSWIPRIYCFSEYGNVCRFKWVRFSQKVGLLLFSPFLQTLQTRPVPACESERRFLLNGSWFFDIDARPCQGIICFQLDIEV